ncbi:hypothetical protein [Treponema bryantii]|uniref:hypothetical protein n=1 Tax=Treponema bryantii TaxID=163 RepID=UPI0003B44D9A|nr:hypothetical protein [Treponema bryantii]
MNIEELNRVVQTIKTNPDVLNNIPEKYLQPKEIRNKLTGAFFTSIKPSKHSKCIYPKCIEEAIASHSIQHALLNTISNPNKEILHFGFDISKMEFKKIVKPIPTSEASTFLGFCNKHDSEIFYPIENNLRPLLSTDNEQMFLLTYRAICREYVKAKESSNTIKKFLSQINNHEELNDYAQFFAILEAYQGYCELHWLECLKVKCDELLQHKKYEQLFDYRYIEIQKQLSLFAESFFAVQGATEDIIYKKDITKEMPLYCAMTIIPNDGHTKIFYSVLKEQTNELKAFLRRFESKDYELECFITDCIIRNCDNFYISEDFWRKIPSDDRKKLQHHFYKTIIDREYDLSNELNFFEYL